MEATVPQGQWSVSVKAIQNVLSRDLCTAAVLLKVRFIKS
jgi:hypothetical protein